MRRDINTLKSMLSYCRPHGSVTEEAFIERFIKPLDVMADPFGNHFKVIGDNPDTLWSCHTDTVHNRGGRQKVFYNPKTDLLFLGDPKASSCLGADCTAGVFIMVEMIKAKVPGLYVFHRAEEIGARGSTYIREHTELLKGITKAIAFDRMGFTSVITYQMGSRTASDAFAKSLIAQLPGYVIDTGGVFTDTQIYADVVPECTNLSVGYSGQHSPNETQHVGTLLALRDAMLTIDSSKLVVARDPSVIDSKYSSYRAPVDKFGLYSNGQIYDLIYNYPKAIEAVFKRFGVSYDALAGAVRFHVDESRKAAEDAFLKGEGDPPVGAITHVKTEDETPKADDTLDTLFPQHHDHVKNDDDSPVARAEKHFSGNAEEPDLGTYYQEF